MKRCMAGLLAAMMLMGASSAYANIADEEIVYQAIRDANGNYNVVVDKTTPDLTFTEPLANNAIRLVVDNEELTARGVSIDGRTLIPLRALGEALGAAVQWDAGKQEIRIEKVLYQADSYGNITDSNRIMLMNIGSHQILENGDAVELEAAPQIINGHTMVPVRAVTDFLEAAIDWDDVSRTVTIQSTIADSPQGALWEKQNLYMGYENAVANRVEEINREAEITRIREENKYIKENKPKGDLKAWGYSLSYDVRSMGDYGAYVEFDIYPGGYQSTKTAENVENEWFWFEILDKDTQQTVFKTAFIYNEVEDKWGDRKIIFPSESYADEDKYAYKFTVVMDRDEAAAYRSMEAMQNEARMRQGNLEDWGYRIEVTEVWNYEIAGEDLHFIDIDITINPLKYDGNLRNQTFRVEVVNKSTGAVEYEKQFADAGLSGNRIELPAQYLDENQFDYVFSVVVD